jgi:hypothetical protein
MANGQSQTVGKFALTQSGVYVCRTMFNYLAPNTSDWMMSNQSGNQTLWPNPYVTDPSELGVPNGSTLYLYVWVMAGYDAPAAEHDFTYEQGNPKCAYYECGGVTVRSWVTLEKVE